MTEQPGPPGDNRPPGSTPPAGEPYSTPQYSTPNYDTPAYDPGSYDPGQGGYEPPSLKKDEPADPTSPWADPGAPPAPDQNPTGYPGGIDPATGLPPQAAQNYGGGYGSNVPSSGTGYGPSSGAGYTPASGPAYGQPGGYGQPPASGAGYGQGGYGQPGAGGYPAAAKTDGLALAAMICGIVAIPFSFCCYGVFAYPLGIAALIMGFISRGNIAKSNSRLTGDGMALSGIICGAVGIVLGICIVILSLAFGFLSAFNPS